MFSTTEGNFVLPKTKFLLGDYIGFNNLLNRNFAGLINYNKYTKKFYLLILSLYQFFILYPMWYVYLNGPSFFGYGFWNRKNYENICQEITHVDQSHWISNEENYQVCVNKINQHFLDFLSGAEFLLFIIFIIFIFINFKKVFYTTKNYFINYIKNLMLS